MTSLFIEIAVAKYLNPRHNLIVPNVHWGMDMHECDLLVITKSGLAWEVEIKTSLADLRRDTQKRHGHFDSRISRLFFAMPKSMEPHIELVPERAGVLLVDDLGTCKSVRKAIPSHTLYRFDDAERYKVARLGALRIWGLKRALSVLAQ